MDKSFEKLRVFISYGHDEYSPFAQGVADELRKRGHDVWFDVEELREGKDWETYIENGLNWVGENTATGRIILIMTPYSVRRPDGFCLNEIAKALDNKLQIIPVMLVWATPPLSIYRLQYLDMQNSHNKTQITEDFSLDISKIINSIENKSYLDKEGGSSSLINSLDPLDFSADLVLNQEWFTGRKWIFERIKSWINDKDSSRVFWIAGVPGIGKTAISTKLLQRFQNIAAFHLCRRSHSEKSSPRRAICSIAYQLSTQLPEYREILQTIDIKEEIDRCNEAALFDRLITQPLSHNIKHPDYTLAILIDGLDEATVGEKNIMAQFIASEFDKLPSWIKVIITSRPDKEVMIPLQIYEPEVISPSCQSNIDDIGEYIDARLAEFISQAGYAAAKAQIIENADGIFLYAQLVCDQISRNELSLDLPKSFPKKLGGFFQLYFENKFPQKAHYRQAIRPALQLLLAALDPLSKSDLKDFLGWNDDNVEDFLQEIGSFIVVTPDQKLTTFHASLFDWLSNQSIAGDFYVDKLKGDQILSAQLSVVTYNDYQIKNVVKHLVAAGLYSTQRVLEEDSYMLMRKARFSRGDYFNLLLSDVEYIHQSGDSESLNSLYSSACFINIVLRNATYFFGRDYYKIIARHGFGAFIDSCDVQQLPSGIKFIELYYHYNIYDIKRAAQVELPIESEEYLSSEDSVSLSNYRFAYEISGSCKRICGDFEAAKFLTQKAAECARILHDEDSEIISYCVLARSMMHLGDVDEAFARLDKLAERVLEIVGELDLESDISRIHHLQSSSVLIYIDLLLNANRLEKVGELIDKMNAIYQDPSERDRYYSRVLYMNARYALQTKNLDKYLEYEELLDPYDINKQGGRLFCHQAIYWLACGVRDGDKELLGKALCFAQNFTQRAYERYDIEIMVEGVALQQVIAQRLCVEPVALPTELKEFGFSVAMRTNLLNSVIELWA